MTDLMVPTADVQKRFGFYQDRAIANPVFISKNRRLKTVPISYAKFGWLKIRDRKVYAIDESLPEDLADAILAATVPDE